ncbi:MAG: hypothetical protein ABSD20_07615 [Terriglobales bacterium]
MSIFRFLALPVLLSLPIAGSPQQSNSTPTERKNSTVVFDVSWPGTSPAHYSIAIESNGNAVYRCDEIDAPKEAGSTGETCEENLMISATTSGRIFELSRQTNYFQGNFNYSKGNVAHTGAKTLTYYANSGDSAGKPAPGQPNQATYNYSENPSIQQLTTIFEDIANTVELGRRLRHLHRFDKLGLDSALKNAEDMAQNHQLLELHLISPTLQDLADDTGLLHIARQRAQHLLQRAGAETRP